MKREPITKSSSSSLTESETSSRRCIKGKKQEANVRLAMISGFFATIGSLFGKIAGSIEIDSVVGILLKGMLLILMVTSNTVGCTFFVKALNCSGSSLPCTIASAATSYVCSAFAGFLIFDESTSICWWCGISFVILGLLLICQDPSKDDNMSSKEFKEE